MKASQDKRFVCEEAEKSLEVMTTWMAPIPLLQKLQPYVKHFNPKVRAKASVCFYNAASRIVRFQLGFYISSYLYLERCHQKSDVYFAFLV